MYSIIRLIIAYIFFACSLIFIKRKKSNRRNLYVVFAGISIVLIILLSFLPFENLFITFNSSREAYRYYNFSKGDIELVVDGDNCDFVIGRKNETDTYLIIPKTTAGWKIGIGSDTKIIVQKILDGVVVYIYQYRDTNDYFVTVFDTNGGETYVSDCHNSNFYSLKRHNEYLEKDFITYYAHISNFDSQYSVIVNGNTYNIGK